jgi:Protein of unknown function (DUF3500)
MNPTKKMLVSLTFATLLLSTVTFSLTEAEAASTSQSSTVTGVASASTLKAINAFIATLTAKQKSVVIVPRTSSNLQQWSNLPDQLYKRAGLRMDTLNSAQKLAELNILKSALSPEGFLQVSQIMAADGVLASSGGMNLDFGADHYWIRFIGTPSNSGIYTIQFGGHHLALNVTVKGKNLTIAPTLWGAQPASYKVGSTTVEPLGGELSKALTMMSSLDATQQKKALLNMSVGELLTGPGADGKTLSPEGIAGSDLNPTQKANLLTLMTEWMNTQTSEMAQAKIATAKSELDKTYFAWAGPVVAGQPIYYRITSPSFMIEFSHQTGGGANAGGITHIHSMYREIGNDYGAALK